ncbi:MAG TPA: hypothetical protein VFN61_12800 [Acidimicrobiales bacterium]|nr:hypothetical protein [Acidimicrobiales bacterium]
MMSRWAKLLIIGAVACLSVPFAGPHDASRHSGAVVSGWAARIFLHGEFTGLAAGRGSLYTAEWHAGVSTIVRVDPTGRVLARSSTLEELGGFSVIGRQLWAVIGIGDVGRPGVPELLAFDLESLKKLRAIRLVLGADGRTSASAWGPVTALGATAWSAFGCELVQVDPSSGRLLHSVDLGKQVGCASRLAIRGASLYVAEPVGLGGSIQLEARNARTGGLLRVSQVPDPPLGVGLVAAGDYLWAAGGDMGAAGDLYLYRASTLRLVGASGTEGGGGPVPGGRGVVRLPATSEYPAIDASAGVVWVGSQGGDAACFDARTGRLEAMGIPRPDVVTGNVVVTTFGTFATGSSPASGASGLVRVTPPTACKASD